MKEKNLKQCATVVNPINPTFLGATLDELMRENLLEARLMKLLAPEHPEYYKVESRNIVGVDDLLELIIEFTTDLQVTVQYGDMMLNDVKKISIMPNVNDEGSYITLYDSNDLQLALILPENEMYSFYIKDLSVEDDIMLFVDVDILYSSAPNMEYPHIWLDRAVNDNGIEEYSIKGTLNPRMMIPKTLVKSIGDMELGITDLAEITVALKGSRELACLPYTKIVVDKKYDCFEIGYINDLYFEINLINSDEHIGVPYTDFILPNEDYTFKHYIDKDTLVVKINKCDSDIDMQIINNRFKDDGKNIALIAALCDHYDALICDTVDESVLKSLQEVMHNINCKGFVMVDSPNEQIMVIKENDSTFVKLI